MIAYSRSDVVLVDVVFTDESGQKRRPVLIIGSAPYHQNRQDVIVAAITSNVARRLVGDHLIGDCQAAGLLRPSVASGIVRTIQRTMIVRRLGTLAAADLQVYDQPLRQSLAL
jgi:mRNA interferase MazF